TVARLRLPDGEATVTAVGNLMEAAPGETLQLYGRFVKDKRFGDQFKFDSYNTKLPTTLVGLKAYLGSGLIPGLGNRWAERLVDRFGEELWEILETDPSRLRALKGFGRKRTDALVQAWQQQRMIRDLMVFLRGHGITTGWAVKIFQFYGPEALAVVSKDPYRLALDISGIGFSTADSIARKLGLPPDAPARFEAGVLHLMSMAAGDGHTYLPFEIILEQGQALLECDEKDVRNAVSRLWKSERLALEKLSNATRAIYLPALYHSEKYAADYIKGILASGSTLPKVDVDRSVALFEEKFKFELAQRQRDAVAQVMLGGVSVLTGGPGTGKTTTVRALLFMLEGAGVRVALCAPTGRAAKRLNETTGHPASTIHRLLKFSPKEGRFLVNERDPLKADLVVVDETSMLEISLAYHLLRALLSTTTVLFVGDSDQLPSVGPGNFLADLINSERVPVIALTEIFRQARRSLIVVNAHRINHGEFPLIKPPEDGRRSDFFFIEKNDPEEILDTIKMLVKERVPREFDVNPIEDIQVITPMHRGILGTANLNLELQTLLNPETHTLTKGSLRIKVGDKVMQIENNYDRDIFNGDIGVVTFIDPEDHSVRINFDGRAQHYAFQELDQIILSYAISVHKSQGSEYRCVVVPLHTQHYLLLQRNLIYTALTRGKRLVCIVGSKKALHIALRNNKVQQRFSALAQRLKDLER
ncbi:MAG: ATP-dependent RecD-like DNA helicase, partial [bacterium]